jgi:hypothetical protein
MKISNYLTLIYLLRSADVFFCYYYHEIQFCKRKPSQEKKSWILFYYYFFKGFDRGDCKSWGFIIPKVKREGQDRRKPAIPRTNFTCLGYRPATLRAQLSGSVLFHGFRISITHLLVQLPVHLSPRVGLIGVFPTTFFSCEALLQNCIPKSPSPETTPVLCSVQSCQVGSPEIHHLGVSRR